MATGRQSGRVARKVYRNSLRLSKRALAKKYANAVGQIVRRKPGKRTKPSRGFRRTRASRNYRSSRRSGIFR